MSEDIFPFKTYIQSYFASYNKSNRNGWYLQQLLKLYAGQIIPGIISNYLVIDADVFFLKPTSFFNKVKIIDSSGFNEINQYVFTAGYEYHKPYFDHMKRLHPTFCKMKANCSGISHHMMFSNVFLKEMMQMVEEHHHAKSAKKNKPFWQIFIDSIKEHLNHDPIYIDSGASEYELYFNYMLQYHPDLVGVRRLKWMNVHYHYDPNENVFNDFDYISIASWYV